MGHKHTREDILDGAVLAAMSDGLSRLTFGTLAKRLGVSDRIVVYYFPTKNQLITDVLVQVGERLQAVLARAFTHAATDHRELARAALPVLARTDVDPLFAVYFEACGMAAAGLEPFGSLAGQLVEGWVGWLSEFFSGDPPRRRAEAEATLALVDGVLLMRQLGGAAAADRAAVALGLRGPTVN